MKLLSKIYPKFPVGYITIYSPSHNEDVELVIDALKSVGLGRLKIKVEDNPDCNGLIVAQRFNIGNFGKYSVVILKDVFPLYDSIDYSAFYQFASTLLDITSFDSLPEVVISCDNNNAIVGDSFDIPNVSPVIHLCKSDDESHAEFCEEDDDDELGFRAITYQWNNSSSFGGTCHSESDSITNEEEEHAVKTAEIDKKEYLDRISAIVLDYVTRFNEMPPMEQIEEILRGKLSIASNKLSPIVVNRDLKIILPTYNELELRLPPLLCTLYILFLKHPEGIVLKHISDYRNEIEDIYILIKPGGNDDIMTSSINEVCNPFSDSLRQKLSKINRIIKNTILNPDLAENYIINGERSQAYRIKLDRSEAILPSCLR